MVKFLKHWFLYQQFQWALKRCAKLNKKGGKFIVVNLAGKPCIIDRKRYRTLRTKGVFQSAAKWCVIKELQIKY